MTVQTHAFRGRGHDQSIGKILVKFLQYNTIGSYCCSSTGDKNGHQPKLQG